MSEGLSAMAANPDSENSPLLDAVEFAHQRGVLHGDLKPANVLLDRKNEPRVTDFGLAKILDRETQLTKTHATLGTPHYMAPEHAERPQEVDHRADIYSLGVVFYEMLTGELPLGRFPAPSQRVQVDVRFDEVVLKALEKEPRHLGELAMREKKLKNELSNMRGLGILSIPIAWALLLLVMGILYYPLIILLRVLLMTKLLLKKFLIMILK